MVSLTLAQKISENFSREIKKHNWAGVKEFGIGEEGGLLVRINARKDFIKLFFQHEKSHAYITVENNEIISHQKEQQLEKYLSYIERFIDNIIKNTLDLPSFPSFVNIENVLTLQKKKADKKEQINRLLDTYNDNMNIFKLFQEEKYLKRAKRIMNALKKEG